MHMLNLAQIQGRRSVEQTGVLLSVSCRLVQSLIFSNSLKYLSRCILTLPNRGRKLLPFSIQCKMAMGHQLSTNMKKPLCDLGYFWLLHYFRLKNMSWAQKKLKMKSKIMNGKKVVGTKQSIIMLYSIYTIFN